MATKYLTGRVRPLLSRSTKVPDEAAYTWQSTFVRRARKHQTNTGDGMYYGSAAHLTASKRPCCSLPWYPLHIQTALTTDNGSLYCLSRTVRMKKDVVPLYGMSARHFRAAAEWSAGMLTRLNALLNTTASRTVHVPARGVRAVVVHVTCSGTLIART